MAAEVSFPVRLRVGEGDECLLGTLTVDTREDVRPKLAEFLHEAADAFAQADTTDDEGGTDGAAGQ